MGLQDQLQASNAPAWIPTDKGDMLCGKVVARATRTTDFGDYEIITLDPRGVADGCATVGGSSEFTVKTAEGDVAYTGGPLAFHAMGSVASNEIDRTDPRPGASNAGILFDGTGIATQGQGKGKGYRIFRVVVETIPGAVVAEAPVAAPAPAAPVASSAGVEQVAAEVPYQDEEPF